VTRPPFFHCSLTTIPFGLDGQSRPTPGNASGGVPDRQSFRVFSQHFVSTLFLEYCLFLLAHFFRILVTNFHILTGKDLENKRDVRSKLGPAFFRTALELHLDFCLLLQLLVPTPPGVFLPHVSPPLLQKVCSDRSLLPFFVRSRSPVPPLGAHFEVGNVLFPGKNLSPGVFTDFGVFPTPQKNPKGVCLSPLSRLFLLEVSTPFWF